MVIVPTKVMESVATINGLEPEVLRLTMWLEEDIVIHKEETVIHHWIEDQVGGRKVVVADARFPPILVLNGRGKQSCKIQSFSRYL